MEVSEGFLSDDGLVVIYGHCRILLASIRYFLQILCSVSLRNQNSVSPHISPTL